MGVKKTSAAVFLFVAILVYSSGQCSALEISTLNFDFGSESEYSGDDGILSSAGGTHWNHVSKQQLFQGFFGGDVFVDEFGASSLGGVFSFLFFEDLVETSSPSFAGPRSDGFALSQQSVAATITFARVRQFEEMVVYFTGPLEGGFGSDAFSGFVSDPFNDVLGNQTTTFPGQENRDYIRIIDAPRLGGGLGEAPTLTIVLANPETTISAIQIRGEFAFVPEPSSGVILLLSLFAVQMRRTRN